MMTAPALRLGTITGRVIDAETRQPIGTVQVFVAGAGLGVLTRADGTYQLANVPAGAHTLQVQRIGYGRMTQSITVGSGESYVVNFELRREMLALDEIVVTGTAGQARRREVGNSIASVNLASLPEVLRGVEGLMQGRSPGVSITASSGAVGAGSQIRLRGVTSTSQGNQPLIYIDGVRMSGDGYPNNPSSRGSNVNISSIDDINPADIERIEIIKGPAATTLYGTDAATGVIQIFTKRGIDGVASWSVETQQGFSTSRKFAPEPEPYYRMDRAMRTGYRQAYNGSVSGGSGGMTYFLSGGLSAHEGILVNDYEEKTALRANFGFRPSSVLAIDVSTGYSQRDLEMTSSGWNPQGVASVANRGPRGSALPSDRYEEEFHRILEQEITDKHGHAVFGITATIIPVSGFSHRVTIGLDDLRADQRNINPFGFVFAPQGEVFTRQWYNQHKTFDYVGNFERQLSEGLRATLSGGSQFQERVTVQIDASSEGLAGPGLPTVTSGALRTGSESRIRVVTGGFFGQLLLGYKDRYFLTAGLRLDGSSAFGENLGLEPYPKLSGSYVVSDEPWWSPAWGDLKLRAAYGMAGRAPGAFDAVRTWTPVGYAGDPGFTTNNVGNPDLGPERSSEIELGFDSSILQNRVSLEFTYYRKTTEDALFSVRQVPSAGWGGSQLENVGTIRSWGTETALTGDLIRSRNLSWNAGLSVTTNRSLTVDLGGAPEFTAGSRTMIIEGEPAPVVTGWRLLNPDELAAPVWEPHRFGPNHPTLILGFSTQLALPKGIVISSRGEYQGGYYLSNYGLYNSIARNGAHFCEDNGSGPYRGAYSMIEQRRANELTAKVRSICNLREFPGIPHPIVPGDFFRLRDLTVQLPLPLSRAGIRVGSGTLSLTAGNWFDWVHPDIIAYDPETLDGRTNDLNGVAREIQETVPPPKTLTASVRVRF